MEKVKFLIMSESYDPNIGGAIVLHKLCDELNRLGHLAKLVPTYNNFVFNKNNLIIPFLKFIKERIRRCKNYQINPDFLTPIAKPDELRNIKDDWVAIYPETISGNPLNARHVVKWFLHHPGFHNKDFLYGIDELYFKYHSGINVPLSLKVSTSDLELRIVHYPTELYNMVGVGEIRKGSAYSIRKGVGKKIVHDLEDSILIDGKSHQDIAAIFKRVKVFYSYDPYTAYSTFAVLCGCDSVVLPDADTPIDSWLPDATHRAGLAYGVEAISRAREERPKLIERVDAELHNNSLLAIKFVANVDKFFKLDT
jgi:hypothetical protein